MKLMIVDDHAEIRGLIRDMIGHLANEIMECASGEDAVAGCSEFQPDVVTMDLHMRAMDGLEATRRILARHPGARVFIVSQSSCSAFRRAAASAGASFFLAKEELTALPEYLRLSPI